MNTKTTSIRELLTDANIERLATLLDPVDESSESTSLGLDERWDFFASTPVDLAINQMPEEFATILRKKWQQIEEAQDSLTGQESFQDILSDSSPELATLEFIKAFGQDIIEGNHARWPRDFGYALYYSGYALALVHRGERMGDLDDADLRQGFGQLASAPWLPQPLQAIFAQAQKTLESGR